MKIEQIKRVITIGLLMARLSIHAQTFKHCATSELHELLKTNDLNYAKRSEQFEKEFQNYTNYEKQIILSDSNIITVPVVVHVLYDTPVQNISDNQIRSQLQVLNEDYRKKIGTPGFNNQSIGADAKIEFALAIRDPNGNKTNGITRTYTTKKEYHYDINEEMKHSSKGGIDSWPSSKYLNIWVCNLVGGYLGYATYPAANPLTDGVVIGYKYFGDLIGTTEAPYNKGRTATHEIGHWLNLIHIWGDADCGNDYVEDTPPSKEANFGCPKGKTSLCSGNTSQDLVEDYMNFTDDACMNIFTKGQAERMRATLSGTRKSITTSDGLLATGLLNASELQKQVEIFPNPSTDLINIYFSDWYNSKNIIIYNSLGQMVQKINNSKQHLEIDVSSYSEGVYTVVLSEQFIAPLRFMVTH